MALTFFWRCESETFSGTDDYSAGDTTPAPNSTASCSATAKVGTNAHDCADGDDFYTFVNSSEDLVARAEGQIAFWYRPSTTWQASQEIFKVYVAASTNDWFKCLKSGSSGTGGLTFSVRNAAVSSSTVATGDIGMTNGNWYFVVCGWDYANQNIKIAVYDTDLVALGTSPYTTSSVPQANFPPTTIDTIELGHRLGGSEEGFFDNYMFSDSYSEALTDYANYTSYTQYGASSGAPSHLSLLGVG